MADIQQQIADGARPLARVGDVIAHGEAIPANVVAMRDRQGGDGRTWVRTSADPLRFIYRTVGERDGHDCPASVLEDRPHWLPLTVVEVDPEPQPAWTGHVHAFVPGEDGCCDAWLATGSPPLTGKVQCGNVRESTCHLPLKGTATGDNQLDVPQPSLGVAWLREAIQRWMPDQWREQAVAVLLELDKPAESGPVVLSLPQVPDGAVALVGCQSGVRYTRYLKTASWERPDDGSILPLYLLFGGDDELTVEFAPPREPRTWPKLDAAPADISSTVEVWTDGGARMLLLLTREVHGRWSQDPGTPFANAYSWGEVLELGEVREVLT